MYVYVTFADTFEHCIYMQHTHTAQAYKKQNNH